MSYIPSIYLHSLILSSLQLYKGRIKNIITSLQIKKQKQKTEVQIKRTVCPRLHSKQVVELVLKLELSSQIQIA